METVKPEPRWIEVPICSEPSKTDREDLRRAEKLFELAKRVSAAAGAYDQEFAYVAYRTIKEVREDEWRELSKAKWPSDAEIGSKMRFLCAPTLRDFISRGTAWDMLLDFHTWLKNAVKP